MLEEGTTLAAPNGDLFTVVSVRYETGTPTLYELAPAADPSAGSVTVTDDEIADLFTVQSPRNTGTG